MLEKYRRINFYSKEKRRPKTAIRWFVMIYMSDQCPTLNSFTQIGVFKIPQSLWELQDVIVTNSVHTVHHCAYHAITMPTVLYHALLHGSATAFYLCPSGLSLNWNHGMNSAEGVRSQDCEHNGRQEIHICQTPIWREGSSLVPLIMSWGGTVLSRLSNQTYYSKKNPIYCCDRVGCPPSHVTLPR